MLWSLSLYKDSLVSLLDHLAQLAEREAFNLVVVGSSPTVGTALLGGLCACYISWHRGTGGASPAFATRGRGGKGSVHHMRQAQHTWPFAADAFQTFEMCINNNTRQVVIIPREPAETKTEERPEARETF